jgi:hypothetical protein
MTLVGAIESWIAATDEFLPDEVTAAAAAKWTRKAR